MGLLGNLLSAAVKTVTTPIAVVKDVANVVTDRKVESTKKHVDSIFDDLFNNDTNG